MFCFWMTLNGENINFDRVEDILSIKLNRHKSIEAPELNENDKRRDMFYGQIAWLLDLVEPHKQKLIDAGVCFEESQIWMLYYYESQCNMEFDTCLLKRMGDLGLKLCVSCDQDYKDEKNEKDEKE